MTRSIALSLLAQGNNGNEILSILDSIAADNVEIDIIEFWSYNEGAAVIRGTPVIRIHSYSWWQYVAVGGYNGGRRVMGRGGYNFLNYPNLQRWQFDRAL